MASAIEMIWTHGGGHALDNPAIALILVSMRMKQCVHCLISSGDLEMMFALLLNAESIHRVGPAAGMELGSHSRGVSRQKVYRHRGV